METFGAAIYEALKENTIIESEPWAVERVESGVRRLGAAHGPAGQFQVIIPWMEEVTAFTAPGRYVFFSRAMFQLCDSEDMAAMVIAHEIAHHDLGHIHVFPEWLAKVAGSAPGLLAVGLFRQAIRFMYGPEQEADADRRGLELCIAAGYDPRKCIDFFHKLEKVALDIHDLGAVYGPDQDDDDELSSEASLNTKVRIWLYQRRRGYLPIRDRREMLLKHLEVLEAGENEAT